MCGIVGFWAGSALTESESVARVTAMRDSVSNRGPDEAGVWVDGPRAFGHRRLSILDLSPAGHQPMSTPDGRWTICYNGEVYNFLELRAQLEDRGHKFRGHSDTEVMLAAFQEWGLAGAVNRFIGMFAFAAWDAREGTMHLVRDRLGVKPLYVGRTPAGDLLFASELKALMTYPGFERRIRPEAVVHFLRYSYVPAPSSIFTDVVKLPPGHSLSIRGLGDPLEPTAYWDLESVARAGQAEPFDGTFEEAEEELHRLLLDAVGLRMIADVPLGAFLSGGIDSSTVVALMQAQSDRPIRTFTIGFEEARYDESGHARAIAEHLGTDHTEQRVTPGETLDVVPMLPTMYDEPMADVSQVPTHLVSALARQHVTVALSGDGGDELFGGYDRYRSASRAWGWVRRVPTGLRKPLAGALRSGPVTGLAAAFGSARHARKLGSLLAAPSLEALYLRLVSTDPDPLALTTFTSESTDRLRALLASSAARHPEERMMLADAAVYLPDDLLTKLDRASMAVALEGRVPILDHRVVEFAWRLPLRLREGKALLKGVLGRHVPAGLYERPKMGFEVPIRAWLRGPLRSWADEMLDPRGLVDGGIFDAPTVRRVLDEHVAGTRDSGHLLWTILMLESWRRHWDASL